MAIDKLPASAEFFKQLSLEFQQLKFIVQVLENYAFQAVVRKYECEASYLLHVLEQLGVLALKIQQLKDEVENCLRTSNS